MPFGDDSPSSNHDFFGQSKPSSWEKPPCNPGWPFRAGTAPLSPDWWPQDLSHGEPPKNREKSRSTKIMDWDSGQWCPFGKQTPLSIKQWEKDIYESEWFRIRIDTAYDFA